MINRVLIRIKVVQLLYSSLLVKNQFAIESAPADPTREKRFAYALYLEALAAMVRIAGNIRRRGGDSPLEDTRFIAKLRETPGVRLIAENEITGNAFSTAVAHLTEKVKESGIYKKFLKSENPGGKEDEKVWEDIFRAIIINDSSFLKAAESLDDYSLSGVERMEQMMEDTFANFYSSADDLHDSLEMLRKSMEKARELYFRLLDLPCRLTALRDADIEERRSAYLATAEDRNPNMRFVENRLVEILSHSEPLQKGLERYGVSWGIDEEPMLRALLKAIMCSDIYKEYMEFPVTDYDTDCEFWKNILRQVVFVNPDFLEAMEEESVFWNDDLDIIGTFVLKTIRRIQGKLSPKSRTPNDIDTDVEIDNGTMPINFDDAILPMFKDEEDANFGKALFASVVNNKELYRQYIDKALDSKVWESDRMAYMDVVVMMTAIAEMLNFPAIPLSVTMNEYIEIAKSYSTWKSGQFVHGLLAKVAENLKKEGLLVK